MALPQSQHLGRQNEGVGWMWSQSQHMAHYYDAKGRSACHRWLMTTLDKPAAIGATLCPSCKDAVALTGERP